MPAVIGPIGVDHADLGQGGVPALFPEIIPAEAQVVPVHGEPVAADEVFRLPVRHMDKAGDGLHAVGHLVAQSKRGNGVQGSLAALHRVDDEFFDRRDLVPGQIP